MASTGAGAAAVNIVSALFTMCGHLCSLYRVAMVSITTLTTVACSAVGRACVERFVLMKAFVFRFQLKKAVGRRRSTWKRWKNGVFVCRLCFMCYVWLRVVCFMCCMLREWCHCLAVLRVRDLIVSFHDVVFLPS